MRAVFAARGGYGTQRIVDQIDVSVLRRDPGSSSASATSPASRASSGAISAWSPSTARWSTGVTPAPAPSRPRRSAGL
ncbi:LD-carboxypeptidase [Micromonospora sp. M12]